MPGSWRAGVIPDMLIDAERIRARQPAARCDPPNDFCLAHVPGGVPDMTMLTLWCPEPVGVEAASQRLRQCGDLPSHGC